MIFFEFLKWKSIDIYRYIKDKPSPHLFGVRCITGMYGQGKTMAMTWIALNYKKKYGDNILISTNYGLGIQDFPFTDISQLTVQYDKPIIFFFDEVQNEFPSSDRNFPKPVRQALTLNRKGNGKMIYWSSQDHELVHKNFRRLTIEFGLVRTLSKRYTRVRWYFPPDYQKLFEENNYDKKMKIKPFKTDKFIQTDYIRSLYNSYSWDNGESLEDNNSILK